MPRELAVRGLLLAPALPVRPVSPVAVLVLGALAASALVALYLRLRSEPCQHPTLWVDRLGLARSGRGQVSVCRVCGRGWIEPVTEAQRAALIQGAVDDVASRPRRREDESEERLEREIREVRPSGFDRIWEEIVREMDEGEDTEPLDTVDFVDED